MQLMQKQNGGGHVFNMDGAGADGMPTPQYAAYGATKAGLPLQEKNQQANLTARMTARIRSPTCVSHKKASPFAVSLVTVFPVALTQMFAC